MFKISDLSFNIGARAIFSNASLNIDKGSRIGLIGRNGSGKTTLFKLLLGELQPGDGIIDLPSNCSVGSVNQEPAYSDQTLIDRIISADKRLADLIRLSKSKSLEAVAEAHAQMAMIGGYNIEARAEKIIRGLGFSHEQKLMPCKAFSGGWRMRIELGATLFAEPDVLLLDEPTNYLDLEGVLWLQEYLARYPHTLIIISHDRDLLNKSVNYIVSLEHTRLALYRGNYDQYYAVSKDKAGLAHKTRANINRRCEQLEIFIDRFRSKPSKARQVQSKIKELNKIRASMPDEPASEKPVKAFSFDLGDTPALPPLVTIDDVSVGYANDLMILKNLNLAINRHENVGLIGKNGNGKSTLAKLIAGRLSANSGSVTYSPKLKIGYFAQHQLDELNPDKTAFDHVKQYYSNMTEPDLRAKTAQIGFSIDNMNTPVKSLSGGEKTRLLIGLISIDKPDLLIFDEPTNHLDIESRQALIDALAKYKGSIILVAHDRYLMAKVADKLWLVENGMVKAFAGGIDDYSDYVLNKNGVADNGAGRGAKVAGSRQKDDNTGKPDKLPPALLRREKAKLRSELNRIEKKIDNIDAELKVIDQQLSAGDIFTSDESKGKNLIKQRQAKLAELNQLEQQWHEISDNPYIE